MPKTDFRISEANRGSRRPNEDPDLEGQVADLILIQGISRVLFAPKLA